MRAAFAILISLCWLRLMLSVDNTYRNKRRKYNAIRTIKIKNGTRRL